MSRTSGSSLIEITVAIGIMTMIFFSLITIFQALSAFSQKNEIHAHARLITEEYIEKIRALPYDSIGTLGGIPSGNIPQMETITRNGQDFIVRVFIHYVDDPADGLDDADDLTADYKKIRVSTSYTYKTKTYTIPIITNVAPRAQESLSGAGVLRIIVVDSQNNPVPSATIDIENTTLSPAINLTTFTNSAGRVSLPGALESTDYHISVSKAGFSSAGTYEATLLNPNPSPSPLSVAENATTEIYFRIDYVSILEIFTKETPLVFLFEDSFTDDSKIHTSVDATRTGNEILLSEDAGLYKNLGTIQSIPTSSSDIAGWLFFEADILTPPHTEITFRILSDDDLGTLIPIPNSIIPENETGFSSTTISLLSLDVSSYPSLTLEALLRTNDTTITPSLLNWRIAGYDAPLPISTSLEVKSNKTIGTDSSLTPIEKYSETHSTNADGFLELSSMEWGAYTLETPLFTHTLACPSLPLSLLPNTLFTQDIFLFGDSSNALKITLENSLGEKIPSALFTIEETGQMSLTNTCGEVLFPLGSEGDYTIEIMHPLYQKENLSLFVSGLFEDTIVLHTL
jgi:hypothetical protein